MFSDGSPRFRKLHFPVGLWINNPKKHFSKRRPSAGSEKSISSSDVISCQDLPSTGISGTFHSSQSSSQYHEQPGSQSSAPSPPRPLPLSLSLSSSTPSLPPSPSSLSSPPSFLRPKNSAQPPQPRHKRLSQLFLRGRSHSDRERGGRGWGGGGAGGCSSPPGLIKIYGDALSMGANYKSVLATKSSTAGEIVADFINRYGHVLRRRGEGDERGERGGGEEKCVLLASDFVLCDVIGRPLSEGLGAELGGGAGWTAECRRGVASSERPLLLMEMWRPKEGFERRFEIRRRDECEREEERKRRGEEEENTAGLVTRRLRPIRSRMASGGGVEDSGRGQDEKGAELRRSISDMHLSVRRRHGTQSEERKHVKSMLLDEGEGLADTPSDLLTAGSKEVGGEEARDGEGRGGGAGGEGERGSGCSDLEKLSQSLILPPTDRPYFLLLQGYTQKKDFVLYVMAGHTHIFGRTLTPAEREKERGSEREREGKRRDKLRVDTFLSAPDILPRHLLVRRDSALRGHAPSAETGHAPSAALVRPFRGGVVTHNGAELVREVKLRPGDVLGLGQHFLFLYKDPRCVSAPLLPALLSPLRSPTRSPPSLVGALCCQACGRSQAERQARLREYLSSTQPVLRYSIAHEEQLLREIVEKNGSPDSGAGALAPAFLLSLCIDHASKHLHPAHLPALLLKTANLVKGLVWDKIKEIGDKQPENQEKSDVSALSIEALTSELRPLMFWMSNATELLNYIQVKVEDMERDLEFESSSDLSADLETSSEALALLDDVIMYTFQQCVYYLTKTLYSALPALLDSNPFSLPPPSALPPDPSPLTPDLSLMPGGVARVLEVYLSTLELTRTCQLHPDLVSQTFGYLLFFSNASLFNTLMERGSGSDSFFTWSRAVQIRTNLDLVLDWLQGAGLGDIANEFFRKLSITVNFLCIPKTRLIHSSWSSLQEEYPLLSPAQLNHLLRHYRLGAGREPPTSWQPPEDSNLSSDIFESFLDHPPLILPNEVSRLGLGEPITSQELQQEVQRIRAFLLDLEQEALPANQRIQL
ncbi:ras-interacting protein 1-like [Acipenser ruthenus]|uniref:ras-interacting protein 1-like n=1 Tax=Acipenser ruthenus TaxID=7906 RepID=UPI002741E080|nr:ras-interacting protein 1-like [Acipenser ruthenus]XP_058874394.1 ras-interacting protein 1-like [Acipenser ruthenus]XP_058874395.1 ras-interacting protein 1-like [Acipenser ruthenus]